MWWVGVDTAAKGVLAQGFSVLHSKIQFLALDVRTSKNISSEIYFWGECNHQGRAQGGINKVTIVWDFKKRKASCAASSKICQCVEESRAYEGGEVARTWGFSFNSITYANHLCFCSVVCEGGSGKLFKVMLWSKYTGKWGTACCIIASEFIWMQSSIRNNCGPI